MAKQLTQKQLENLAKGRKSRLTRIHAQEYVEALKKNLAVKSSEEKIVTYQTFEARIKYAIRENERLTGTKLTRKQAIAKITLSKAFMSQNDIYKKAITDYMSLGDKNSLRKMIADKQGTKYKETTIDWSKFSYESGLQAIVDSELGIYVKIVSGKDSTEPDFVQIGEC